MIRLRFILLITASIFLLSNCKNKKKTTVKPVKITFKKEGELTLYKNDSIIKKIDIEIADTEYDIQTGLMYRNNMKDNQGMLFVFPKIAERYFYMKNTRFPLDIIFFNHNKQIVSFQENAQPLDEKTLPSKSPAQFVLEVNAGLAEKWGLDVGDKMDYFELIIEE